MLDEDRQTVRRTVEKRPHDAQQVANDVGRGPSLEIMATTPISYRRAAKDEGREPLSEITAMTSISPPPSGEARDQRAIVGDDVGDDNLLPPSG